jgi:hypothetical protein
VSDMDTENDIFQNMGIELDNETPPTQEPVEQTPEQPVEPKQTDSAERATDYTGEQRKAEAPKPDVASTEEADGRQQLKSDAHGNLVNEQGRVVATAGRERRYYERMHKSTSLAEQQSRYIRDLETKTRELEQSSSSVHALNGMPAQLGLNNQEASMGLKLIQSYKRDPIGTIKYILTEAAASGHNINDLIGREGGIDTQAISHMIDQRLQPITQQYTQQQAEVQARQEAERQINQFYARYPDAPVHEDVIGKMLQMDASLSLEGAYAQLLRVAQANGLDFSQPLRPQLEAKQNAPQTNARQPSAPPSGRVPTATMPASNTAPVNDTVSYKDIIKQTMLQAGMNFDQ